MGIVSTVTVPGSALARLAVGARGYRFAGNKLLLGAAVLMAHAPGFAAVPRGLAAAAIDCNGLTARAILGMPFRSNP